MLFRFITGLGLASYFLGSWSGSSYEAFWSPYFPMIEWQSLVERFPNVLDLFGSPQILLALMSLVSLGVALGFFRKFLSSLLIYGLGCLHHAQYLSITPNSLAVMFLLLILMVVPEKESHQLKLGWRFPRPVFQVSSVIVVFFYVLLVAPFQLPNRLMLGDQSLAVHHLSLEWQVLFSLFILSIPLKNVRWVFWLASLLLSVVVLFGQAGWMNAWYLIPFLLLSIDPRWFTPSSKTLVFYDGHCGLCHGFVQFLLEIDWQQNIHFSALQSPYAQDALKGHPQYLADLSSVVVLSDDQLADKSKAVALVFKQCGGIWAMLGLIIQVLPLKLADWGYELIAQRRYQWFGRKEVCSLPSPEQRSRFIENAAELNQEQQEQE